MFYLFYDICRMSVPTLWCSSFPVTRYSQKTSDTTKMLFLNHFHNQAKYIPCCRTLGSIAHRLGDINLHQNTCNAVGGQKFFCLALARQSSAQQAGVGGLKASKSLQWARLNWKRVSDYASLIIESIICNPCLLGACTRDVSANILRLYMQRIKNLANIRRVMFYRIQVSLN